MSLQKLELPTTVATDALSSWGDVGAPLSTPACALKGVKMTLALDHQPEVGIWECTPGRFRRQVRSAETMHVLSGEAVFTPDGGDAVTLRAGDVYFFPFDTTGVWEIRTTMRKLYLLFKPQ